jgi:hypothetical protein
VTKWVLERISGAIDTAVDVTPGGLPVLLLVVLVVVALLVLLRVGLGPVALRDKLTDRRRGARARTPDEYREEADGHAAAGDFKEAVRARFRAIIRELEVRAVLDPRAGRTAGEIAREGGAAVPAVAPDLNTVAATFDLVWYGRHEATLADYATIRDADQRIRGARLVPVDA